MDAMDRAHAQDYQDQRRMDTLRIALVAMVKDRPSRLSNSTADSLLCAAERLLEDARRIDRSWD